MKIEIITTGDEVTSGVIVDTNTAWISARCSKHGHEVIRHSSVRDDINDMVVLFSEAAKRADAVIVTGGLGPTADDLTIEAAAKAFGMDLKLDKDALEKIRAYFERIGREMSPSNEKQAMIPVGASVIPNPVGTAPGVRMKVGETEFFFFPGVPKELYKMFEASVEPWLSSKAKECVCERVLNCFGMPEATLDEKLKGIDLSSVRLSFRVKFPEILLKVVARSSDERKAMQIAGDAIARMRETLGNVVYGEGDESLPSVVGCLLRSRGLSIAVAESCTGGLLSDMLTDIPGSSEYFERGVISYSNRSKIEVLGVSEDLIKAHGACSKEVAAAMSFGIRGVSNSSIGIGITGIAGPGGATPEKPVGTVHIAIASEKGIEAQEYHFPRDRRSFKQLAASTALNMVRKILIGKP